MITQPGFNFIDYKNNCDNNLGTNETERSSQVLSSNSSTSVNKSTKASLNSIPVENESSDPKEILRVMVII
jgi:hypothetical protein